MCLGWAWAWELEQEPGAYPGFEVGGADSSIIGARKKLGHAH